MSDQTAAVAPTAAAGSAAANPTPTAPGLIGPDGKLSVAALRAAYPMYANLSDDQLLIGVHRKLYPDIPPSRFYAAVNYDTDAAKYDPSKGTGTLAPLGIDTGIELPQGLNRFQAGMGKTFSDVGSSVQRVGNMAGIGDYDQAKAAEDQKLAQPLMATGAGKAGKFAGDLALTAIPMAKGGQILTKSLAALPGAAGVTLRAAAPYVAAAGTGATTGALLTPDNMSGGAGMGAALGPLGEFGGRAAQALYQGGKATIEPLWDAGRQRILKRTMERFASDPNALRAGANNPQVLVPGYTPTLAEATGDTGVAQLQRGAQSAMPDVASALSDANSQRLQAYRGALDDLAGNDGKIDFFKANRAGNAEQNYGAAFGTPMAMTPELQAQFEALMQRPSIQAAQGPAKNLALEKGMNIENPDGSVAGLHYINQALGDQASAAAGAGNTTLAGAIGDTKRDFLAALNEASPAYGKASAQYAADSRPINQMLIGQKLRDTMIPALGDFNDDLLRSRAQQYAQALRDSAGTARRATGQDTATLENTLDAPQFQTVNDIARDAARYTAAQEAGKVPGSPTAQYLGAQNIMRQTLGPLGFPNGLGDTALGRMAAGVMSLPFNATKGKTEELLARALRDPAVAAQILATKDAAPWFAPLTRLAAPVAVDSSTNK